MQETPREGELDEKPDKVWLPCIEGSLGEGVYPCDLAAGQSKLTFLMMFGISLSRNSWVLLALSSAAIVCP